MFWGTPFNLVCLKYMSNGSVLRPSALIMCASVTWMALFGYKGFPGKRNSWHMYQWCATIHRIFLEAMLAKCETTASMLFRDGNKGIGSWRIGLGTWWKRTSWFVAGAKVLVRHGNEDLISQRSHTASSLFYDGKQRSWLATEWTTVGDGNKSLGLWRTEISKDFERYRESSIAFKRFRTNTKDFDRYRKILRDFEHISRIFKMF